MPAMIRSIPSSAGRYDHDSAVRGYRVVYRAQERNFCPGCGRSHWWLGRMSAECCSCGTAIPFADIQLSGNARHVKCGFRESGCEIE
jgi:hypothetical protein